jgi:hypothetical protein
MFFKKKKFRLKAFCLTISKFHMIFRIISMIRFICVIVYGKTVIKNELELRKKK